MIFTARRIWNIHSVYAIVIIVYYANWPLYPLLDFKALCKYCIIIMVADHYIFAL